MAELLKRLITGIILIGCFIGAYLHSLTLYILFLSGIFLLMLTIEWPRLLSPKSPRFFLFTLAYPITPCFILLWLAIRYYTLDYYLPLYPFFVAWTADTFGYIVGKLTGYHKICPLTSPGKSYEGLVGSMIGVFIMHTWLMPRMAFLSTSPMAHNMFILALYTIIITVIAFLGGYLLSLLKRRQNLKDAGTILPGHGGFLDRFDSVFFVSLAMPILLLVF